VFAARDYTGGMRACHDAGAAFALLALATLFGPSACSKKSDAATSPLADVTADEHGFSPPSVTIPAGGPGSHGTVSFIRTTDKTCATEVVFPDLKIDLPTDKAQTLTFQCGMAMYKGAVVVRSK